MPLPVLGGVAMMRFICLLLIMVSAKIARAETAYLFYNGHDGKGYASCQAACAAIDRPFHKMEKNPIGNSVGSCYPTENHMQNNWATASCTRGAKTCDIDSNVNRKWNPTKSFGYGLIDLQCENNCLIGRQIDVTHNDLNQELINNDFMYTYKNTGKVCRNGENGNFEIIDDDPAIYLRCPSGKGHFLEGTNPSDECLGNNEGDDPDPPVDVYKPCPSGMGSYKVGNDPEKVCKKKPKSTYTPGDNGAPDNGDGDDDNTDHGNFGAGSAGGNDGQGNSGNAGSGSGSQGGGGATHPGGNSGGNNGSGGGDADGDNIACPSGEGTYPRGTEPDAACLGEGDGGSGEGNGEGEGGDQGEGEGNDQGNGSGNGSGQGSGSGEGNGQGNEQGSISGGNCETKQAPQCKGDPVQCYIAVEQWRTACAATREGNKIEGGDSCDKPIECKGDAVQCHIAKAQHDQMCRNRDFDNAGRGLNNLDLGDGVTLNSPAKTIDDFKDAFLKEKNVVDILKDFDASGFLRGKRCMSPNKFSVGGYSFEISWDYWCLFLEYVSYFLVAMGYWHGLRIFSGSVE